MKKRDFFKNLSLTGLACLIPNLIKAGSVPLNIIPNNIVMNKWYPVLNYADQHNLALYSLNLENIIQNKDYMYEFAYHFPPDQVRECVMEMENFETKCLALTKTNLELAGAINKVLRIGIPSIRRKYGRKSTYSENPAILFKEVNEKGILVNLENSKRDDIFISWNAWIFSPDITSWNNMSNEVLFMDYIMDEQYRLTQQPIGVIISSI